MESDGRLEHTDSEVRDFTRSLKLGSKLGFSSAGLLALWGFFAGSGGFQFQRSKSP